MKRPYYTRKDLISISLALFYSFIFAFVGMCLDTNSSFVSKKNPIAGLAQALNLGTVESNATGFVFIILVALYVSVFCAVFLYERRFAVVNHKKTYSLKMILTYFLSFIVCGVLSIGVGFLIQMPLTIDKVIVSLQYAGVALVITTIIYAVLFALIGGVIMFVVNFLLIDKPFRAFEDNNEYVIPEEEHDATVDVTNSFDAPTEGVQGGAASGVGGYAGGGAGGESSMVRATEELDDREKVFPALSTVDVKYDGFAVEQILSDEYSLEEICVRFRNYLAKVEKLYYDLDVIRYFISGLGTTHFMILEGLSGTGKSSLPRYFAKFIQAEVLFIPVQATWRDRTNLIGFFNEFSKTYTESEFLINLYEANYNPDKLYFYVLDEMNISRVEYYFADFLSVLEYPVEDWKLKVMQLPYNFIPPAKLNEGIIQIPENAYFVGTANKDDSTFTITDKVYDRAITIDFDNRNDEFEVEGDADVINISKSHLFKLYDEAKNDAKFQMTKADFDKFTTITDFIYDQFDITFGNRILNQISTLVPVYGSCGGSKEEALDFLLSRKVIAKIEGRFEEYVKGALKELLALIKKTYGAGVLKRSEKTIQTLMRRL